MAQSAESIIAALNAFVAKDDGNDEGTLYDILEGFEQLSDRQQVFPAMFAVLERHPDADLGSPGPLVHSIETLSVSAFEPLLRASVQTQPGYLNVWMINRILNSKLFTRHRQELLTLLRIVMAHPRASPAVRQTAEKFLQFQTDRHARRR
jgi:hypothetical protein